jgi:hypothetical protein
MNGETLGEISEKISEIDSLIFRADTGQITITWEQYKSLHEDVETLMNMLAQSLAQRNGSSAAAMYEERDKVRRSMRLAATVERYCELHPGPDPAVDAIFRVALKDESASAQEKLADLMMPMFANKPVPPATADTKRGFLGRMFGR